MLGPHRTTTLLALLAASPVAGRFRHDRQSGRLQNRCLANNDLDLSGDANDALPRYALLLGAPEGEAWLSLHSTEDDAMAHAAGAEVGGWSGEYLLDLHAGEGFSLAMRLQRSSIAFALDTEG